MRGVRRGLVGICLVTLTLAACGGDGEEDTGTPPAGGETGATEPEPGPETDLATGEPTDAAGEATLMVAATSLGDVLADAEGLTLYMFDPDAQGASTCYDQCEQAWPPLTVDGEPVAGEGVDESLLGVAAREDGSQQVTYDGWPLYYFAQDSAAGDTNGQGVNDVWWVVDAAGQPVRE